MYEGVLVAGEGKIIVGFILILIFFATLTIKSIPIIWVGAAISGIAFILKGLIEALFPKKETQKVPEKELSRRSSGLQEMTCEYLLNGRCTGSPSLIELRGSDCQNEVKDACCYGCAYLKTCKISCDSDRYLTFTPKRPKPANLCPQCKKKVSKNFALCPYCGAKLKKNCPSCGKELQSDFKLCPYCGKQVASA
jgi:hypothetical protein